MNTCFSYSVLERNSNSAKIVIYICNINDLDSLQKSLMEYCEKYKISYLLIKDDYSNKWSTMESYFNTKRKESKNILSKSFDSSFVNSSPVSEFLPVYQII